MIRLLTEDEVPKLIPLGLMFFRESKSSGRFNAEAFVKSFSNAIRTRTGFVLVNDVNGSIEASIGGTISACPFTGDRISAETFYYAHPGKRTILNVRLLVEFERVSKCRGAKRCWMAHLNDEAGKRIEMMYLRRGYVPRETMFQKELT